MDQLGKIRRYHRKERLKISIFAKFEVICQNLTNI